MEKKSNKYLLITLGAFFLSLLIIVTIIYFSKPSIQPSEYLTCKTIQENGLEDEKIDILFVFDNVNEDKAEDYMDYLLAIEPFAANREKFNFYSLDAHPDCELKNNILFCYNRKLIKEASACPHDYIIVLSKHPLSVRSSAYTNFMSINTAHPKTVLIHEFGHAFANLADEYVPSRIPLGSRNCVQKCENFDSETDGCFEGCSYDDRMRSVDSGVMRTLRTSEFGIYDIKIVNEALDRYK